jgi:cytochrome c-type biogenesis protein CcmE
MRLQITIEILISLAIAMAIALFAISSAAGMYNNMHTSQRLSALSCEATNSTIQLYGTCQGCSSEYIEKC